MSDRFTSKWNYPTTVWVGRGRAAELAQACGAVGVHRPLLVTDSGLAEHSLVQEVLSRLRTAAPETPCFSQVKSNPTERNVTEGVAAFRDGRHDGVVALGGGSALDAGKAVAFMAGQQRPIWDFEDVGDWWTRANTQGIAPVIAIPTTAGTGSEVGRAAVITQESTHVKKIIFHPKMLPALAILDPELTVGLPRPMTAAAGIDAFSHCFEAFFAPAYHPLADGIALQGMRLVKEHLPRAYADGSDLEARMQMLSAASMGATAFQKGLGGVHGLAHAIGALHDTHHGLTVGILLPYVLAFNAPEVGDRIALAAAALELPQPTPDALIGWLVALRKELGIPHTLTELGVTRTEAQPISELALADPSTGGNPRTLSTAAYVSIFQAACEGRL
jgi:alcohol dehydrogenase class IV